MRLRKANEMPILTDVPFEIPPVSLPEDMARLVLETARPRVCFEHCSVGEVREGQVEVGGRVFSSRVLSRLLSRGGRVWCFVVTAGPELEAWAAGLDAAYRDAGWKVQLAAVHAARAAVRDEITRRFEAGPLARMTPGSLEDWPLSDQEPLFGLLGHLPAAIGVRLDENCFMTPAHSSSGFLFEGAPEFVQCELCPRRDCPGREKALDPSAPARYGLTSGESG